MFFVFVCVFVRPSAMFMGVRGDAGRVRARQWREFQNFHVTARIVTQ